MQPPVVVLQSILTLFVAEKQQSKLAELVKTAVRKGVVLDKSFCQKVLVELRHWGRDPDSISAAYKLLRKLDEGSSLDAISDVTTVPAPPGKLVNCNHRKIINLRRSTSLTASSVPSPPPPPPPARPRSESVTEASQYSSVIPANMSLKTVLHSSLPGSEKADPSGILKLIEVRMSVSISNAIVSHCIGSGCSRYKPGSCWLWITYFHSSCTQSCPILVV